MAKTTGKILETITSEEFQKALGHYNELVQRADEPIAKPGQKTLVELDTFRYEEAPSLFALKKPSRPMRLDDVKTLVEWKLKHGKFRPTLMKLVSSNDESFVEGTIKNALDLYKKPSDTPAALNVLTKLKGIGPATASLLLAVHDPDNVIFFSDEAFYWLCRDGKRESIKYNAKEYKELSEKARDLTSRLKVSAVDVERVAYVLMNNVGSESPATELSKVVKKPVGGANTEPVLSKRKQSPVVDDAPILRRSKRGRQA
ncbi:hypothetical protein VM1G_06119 [Cytospora mali]|uniref:Uncharacterized protein n=1 Tax=Cytospora mali TaxID=578113 RepID=A0A194W387_CYTMA|nr:hypothetical protein VM1G_06119 [Valsa mali]